MIIEIIGKIDIDEYSKILPQVLIDDLIKNSVVRCKDCRHSRIEGDTTMFMWCGYWNKPTYGIRYCSDGERRE